MLGGTLQGWHLPPVLPADQNQGQEGQMRKLGGHSCPPPMHLLPPVCCQGHTPYPARLASGHLFMPFPLLAFSCLLSPACELLLSLT